MVERTMWVEIVLTLNAEVKVSGSKPARTDDGPPPI